MRDQELQRYLMGMGRPFVGEEFWVADPDTKPWDILRRAVGSARLFPTINDALPSVTASQYDVVNVAPYYTELMTTADQIDLDKAGLALIGHGRGSAMPKLDYTDAAGELTIGAADVLVKNIRCRANDPDILKAVNVEAAGDNFILDGLLLDVDTTTTDEFLSAIDIAAGANNGEIIHCRSNMGLGNATQAVHFNGTSIGHRVAKNYFIGDYSTAVIAGSTTLSTLLELFKNTLVNGDGSGLNAQPCIELNGNSTGIISFNWCVCNLVTMAAAIVAAQCLLFENYYNEDISGAGTGALIGTPSANDS